VADRRYAIHNTDRHKSTHRICQIWCAR